MIKILFNHRAKYKIKKINFSFLLLITIIGIAGIMILFTKYYFDQKKQV